MLIDTFFLQILWRFIYALLKKCACRSVFKIVVFFKKWYRNGYFMIFYQTKNKNIKSFIDKVMRLKIKKKFLK